MPFPRPRARNALLIAVIALVAGCQRASYDPALATEPYPDALHLVEVDIESEPFEVPLVEDMQVFREGTSLRIENFTPRGYSDFKVWINQRFMRDVESLPPGGSVKLSLWTFRDEFGEPFNAGGFWRRFEPANVRLVQIQRDDELPLISLVTVFDQDRLKTRGR